MSDYRELIIGKMSAAFALCPACAAEDSFKVVGMAKNRIQCTACKAEWDSAAFPQGESWAGNRPQEAVDMRMTELTLYKAGKNRDLRVLENTRKTVAWWQFLRTDARGAEVQDVVHALLADLGNPDHDHDAVMQDLDNLGPLGRAEIEGIADFQHFDKTLRDAKEHRQRADLALLYLADRGDPRYAVMCRAHMSSPDEKFRADGVAAAMWWFSRLGDDTLLPPVIDLLAHDPSVAVRVEAAWALRLAGPKQAAIDALTRALEDFDRPDVEPIIAGSWAGFFSAAARARYPVSVNEAASRALAEIDNLRAAEIVPT